MADTFDHVPSSDARSVRRKRSVRQERIVLNGGEAFLEVGETRLEVADCSSFGLALLAETEDLAIPDNQECRLTYRTIAVGSIRLRKIRQAKICNNVFRIACVVTGNPINVERIKAIQSACLLMTRHVDAFGAVDVVPERPRGIVFELADWLESLKQTIAALENKYELNCASERHIFDDTVAGILGDYIVQNLQRRFHDLDCSLKTCDERQVSAAFKLFRCKLQALFQGAPFFDRAFNKPLGYAGDYQMMNQIYAPEALGDSLFAKCLHMYFISAPESRAVRHRAEYLYSLIVWLHRRRKKLKILSVASGPAMEIQYIFKRQPEIASEIEVHLLDQDGESLQHAQRALNSAARDGGISPNCKFIRASVKKVIATGLEDAGYDFIYAAGLFDYLSDSVAQALAERLFGALAEKGELVIGNFSTSSPGRITMDIALDWHLIYRSADDLKRLFSHVGPRIAIEQEPEGICLFCHLDRE
ncbi:MAG: hypothetical protein LC114_14015 [Bryobacterales bacterium]|nr:hypothetical protein [Bryobacterales bacterium]